MFNKFWWGLEIMKNTSLLSLSSCTCYCQRREGLLVFLSQSAVVYKITKVWLQIYSYLWQSWSQAWTSESQRREPECFLIKLEFNWGLLNASRSYNYIFLIKNFFNFSEYLEEYRIKYVIEMIVYILTGPKYINIYISLLWQRGHEMLRSQTLSYALHINTKWNWDRKKMDSLSKSCP